MFIVLSSLKDDVSKSTSAKRPSVFLGGYCKDNDWREEIKKEFSKKFLLMDPYDTKWKAEENIYNELAGLINADYVVFYKGNQGTRKEKNFLNTVQEHQEYKEFDSLYKLKKYLESISSSLNKKCASEYIRSIVAKMGQSYEFSSTQVDLPEDIAKKVIIWGKKNVPESILYKKDNKYGLENEIHVTLLYGLKDELKDNTEKVIKDLDIKPFDVTLGTITAFKDDKDYDVLKIDVDSPELQKLHYVLEKEVENENSHPTFNAHVTVAYLKKGAGDKLIGSDAFRGTKFRANDITFSSKNGEKTSIKLG